MDRGEEPHPAKPGGEAGQRPVRGPSCLTGPSHTVPPQGHTEQQLAFLRHARDPCKLRHHHPEPPSPTTQPLYLQDSRAKVGSGASASPAWEAPGPMGEASRAGARSGLTGLLWPPQPVFCEQGPVLPRQLLGPSVLGLTTRVCASSHCAPTLRAWPLRVTQAWPHLY